jgi:hypothetical protein
MTTTDRAAREARLAEIAERHAKATPGPWRSDYQHIIAPPSATEVDVIAKTPDLLDGGYTQGLVDAHFIARAHQDIPYLLAELASADTRAKEMAGLLREASARLSNFILQPDPNLTKQICALCDSWVWDDSEENQKPVAHASDCLITRLRTAADQS